MPHMTYYDLLHIRPDATDDIVRAAYRQLVKRYHPDANPLDRSMASARFRLIQNAYENLRDPQKRATYDQHLKMRKWHVAGANNDNHDADFSDMFTAARRTLERLMRMVANTRDIGLQSPRGEDQR